MTKEIRNQEKRNHIVKTLFSVVFLVAAFCLIARVGYLEDTQKVKGVVEYQEGNKFIIRTNSRVLRYESNDLKVGDTVEVVIMFHHTASQSDDEIVQLKKI